MILVMDCGGVGLKCANLMPELVIRTACKEATWRAFLLESLRRQL